MGNCIIGYRNWPQQQDIYTPVYSKGDWLAESPLSNLSTRFLNETAVSTDAAKASTQFEVFLGTSREMSLLSFPSHNLTNESKIRHKSCFKPAFDDVTVAVAAVATDTDIEVQVPVNGTARFRAGDKIKIPGHSTEYVVQNDLDLGWNLLSSDSEAVGSGFPPQVVHMNRYQNLIEAPDGTMTADKLVTQVGEDHFPFIRWRVNDFSAESYTSCFSVYVKPKEQKRVMLSFGGIGAAVDVVFDLVTGEILDQQFFSGFGGGSFISAGAYDVGNGWFRLWAIIVDANTTFFNSPELWLVNDANETTYDVTSEKGLYVWGAQYSVLDDNQDQPPQYIKTDGSRFDAANTGTLSVAPALDDDVDVDTLLQACNGDYYSTTPLDYTDWTDVWNIAYTVGILPYGHPSWFSLKVDRETAKYYRFPYVKVFAPSIIAPYHSFEFDDTNNPAGYVSLGLLWLSTAWTPTINMQYGASLGWDIDAETDISLGSVEFTNRFSTFREILGNIQVEEDEALQLPFEIKRISGTDQQIFFVFNKDDTIHLHRRAFLGTFKALNKEEFPYFNQVGVPFQIKEVIG